MKVAVFPGSFDPITFAHIDIIQRALPLFDKIIIALGVNSTKKYLLSLEDKKKVIETIFQNENKIHVSSYSGLTTEYCKSISAGFIIRGLRSVSDFEFEKPISQNNQKLAPEVQTLFLVSSPGLEHISSTIVREIHSFNGNLDSLVPAEVIKILEAKKSL